MKTVEIDGVSYKLRYTLRALFVYEELAGHPYTGEKMLDSYMLLYAMIIACNEEAEINFNQLIDACDKDTSIYRAFSEVLQDEIKKNSEKVQPDNKKKANRSV